MKSPQNRINAQAQRREMKDDAVDLVVFLAKGAAILIASACAFFVFDEVVDLSERTSYEILSPISADR